MTTPLGAAIAAWHELLDGDLAADTHGMLDAEMRRRGLIFGERPLCTVLRPRLFAAEQWRFLEDGCEALLRAFGAAYRAALQSAELRRQFRLTDIEESLLAHDPGFTEFSPHSRIDAFYLPEERRFSLTEFNGENPAGSAYNDSLTDVFLALPATREFLRRHRLRPLPARHGMLHALLHAWRAFSGSRTLPRVAILDWDNVPTKSEFVLYEKYFRDHGLEVVIADPRNAVLEGGRLVVGGGPVDVIYKRVLISELLEECGRDHDVVKAVETRAVCMVNPFRCKILHKKASLAVLSDERNSALFGKDEAAAIAAHIPWTRVVEERKTLHGGKRVDLVPFLLASKDRMVLKPNDAYGGEGIVLGWSVDEGAWETAVRGALDEPHVVQERVPIPAETYPSWADGKLHFAERILDTAPFAVDGTHVEGCLSRLSTAALVNVTAGGGSQVPTFLVEAR